jgi:hypothetical protein
MTDHSDDEVATTGPMPDGGVIADERKLIRARGRDAEAKRSIRLAVLLVVLSGVVAAVASANTSRGDAGRISAVMLVAVLFLVASVTCQVSWGRYVQGRRTIARDDAGPRLLNGGVEPHLDPSGGPHPRRHPLRIVGWLLTVVPVLVVAAVLGGCGLYLADNLADARLHADADSDVLAALWIITGLTWLLAAAATPACLLTLRLPRPRARRLPDKDSLAETLPMRSASGSRRRATDSATPLVLAFSGGGIRSASFCLGGFNALQDMESTGDIDAMVSVSGGSYAASAIALTRTYAGDGTRPQPQRPMADLQSVFGLDSPELAYLRRNSRYIFQPWWRTLSGIWQMLGGALLNIFLAVAALRFFAWLVGWYSKAVGIVSDLDGRRPQFTVWPGRWVDRLLAMGPWALPLVLVAVLLVVQFVRRGLRGGRLGRPSSGWWAKAMATCTRLTVLGLLALVVVPAVQVGLSTWGYQNRGGAKVASAIVNLGFTRPGACAAALTDSADRAHTIALRQARLEGRRSEVSYGACGASGAVAVGGPPAYTDAYDRGEAVTAAGGVDTKSGVSGQLTSVIVLVAAALASLRRAFTAVGKSMSGRTAAVRRWLLLRLPLAALGVLGLWLMTMWSYQYEISAATQTQFVGPLIIMAGVILQLMNPNLTSIHEFYRERISSAFAVGRDQADPAVARNLPYSKPYWLSELQPAPELVLCTTANVNDQRVVPARRFGVPLTMSPQQVRIETGGLVPSIGYQDTRETELDPRGPSLTVMSAVAMSGAAVSPMMGRMGGKVAPFRLLLTLFNVRLGVWVMNPRWPLGEADAPALAPMSTNPRLHQLAGEAFGSTLVDDRWVYLTDGGHLDNLGLVEAVRRLPHKVLAMSASNDPPGSWQDVGAAVSVIRADLGIDLRVMDRDRQDTWMRLKADAPYDIDVLVVRAAMTKLEWLTADDPKEEPNPADEPQMPIDSRSFATRDPNFPRASTGRQDFGDLEFESYRRLGQFLVHRALTQNPDFLTPAPGESGDAATLDLTGAPVEATGRPG